jgi:hypothetical protein
MPEQSPAPNATPEGQERTPGYAGQTQFGAPDGQGQPGATNVDGQPKSQGRVVEGQTTNVTPHPSKGW